MRVLSLRGLWTIALFTLVPVALLFGGDLWRASNPLSQVTLGWYIAAASVGFVAGVFVAAMNTQKPRKESMVRMAPPPPY